MMKMCAIVGTPPAQFASFERYKEELLMVKNMGYVAAEIPLHKPLGFDPDELADFCAKENFPIVSGLTGINSYDEGGLFLSVPDADIRRKAVERLRELLPVAKKLNAVMVIGTMLGTAAQERDAKIGHARVVDCLKQVAETAEKLGATVVLEPMDQFSSLYDLTYEATVETIRMVGSSAIVPMLDTFHMNIEEKDLIEVIRKTKGNIRHVHLSETNNATFGKGHLDFPNIFAALAEVGYAHYVSVKCDMDPWPQGAQDSLNYLRVRNLA